MVLTLSLCEKVGVEGEPGRDSRHGRERARRLPLKRHGRHARFSRDARLRLKEGPVSDHLPEERRLAHVAMR